MTVKHSIKAISRWIVPCQLTEPGYALLSPAFYTSLISQTQSIPSSKLRLLLASQLSVTICYGV